MRIGRPLLKLPIHFCGDTLAREVQALPDGAWIAHPQAFDGNSAAPLVSPHGAVTQESFGPMAPTKALQSCPYVLQIMQELDSTWGRSRLMALDPGAIVPEHVDIHYYWRTHLRIHIPVITNPGVEFVCDGQTFHMRAGECWLLDSFYKHSVANRGDDTRVHLVFDTVGSGRLWDLVQAARSGVTDPKFLRPGAVTTRRLDFEQINAPLVMSPWEIKAHVAYLSEWTDEQSGLAEIMTVLDRFVMSWAGTWARYGTSDEGVPYYLFHLQELQKALPAKDETSVRMKNGWPLVSSIERFIVVNAIAPTMLRKYMAEPEVAPAIRTTV